MSERPYCKVYLTGFDDPVALRSLVAEAADGVLRQRTVQSARQGGLVIDVFVAGHSDTPASDADDFVLWPGYLEVEPVEGALTERADVFVAELARVVCRLRANGLRSVAAGTLEAEVERAALQLGD